MGGSRRNDHDRKRIAGIITNPDVIVSDAEKQRCLASVTAYNHQLKAWLEDEPCPSLGVACIAGFGWMEIYCGGCRQIAVIDLARVNAHPLARIKAVAARLRCTRCRGDGPVAKILSLRKGPYESIAERAQRKRQEKFDAMDRDAG